MGKEKLDIAALPPGDLARLLSQSLKKTITEEQVREVASLRTTTALTSLNSRHF